MKIILCLLILLPLNCAFAVIEQTNFYGYGQIDYSVSNKSGTKPVFEITRLNLIGDFELSSNTRFISDIEFEHNVMVGPKGTIGNVKFSQIWAEYSFFPELKVRAGKFLTDVGLYNKIHDASPTYFSIGPPVLYSRHNVSSEFTENQRFFGKYVLGAALTGTIDLGQEGSQLEYTLMFGNGRNDYVGNKFIDQNTSYSGRVVYRPAFINGLNLGASFYTDENQIGMAGYLNSREVTAGIELQYEIHNIQFQAEALNAQYKSKQGKDLSALLSFAQIAYTVYDKLTPYIQVNYLNLNPDEKKSIMLGIFGLNYSISPNFFLKAEAQYNSNTHLDIKDEFGAFKSSISVVF